MNNLKSLSERVIDAEDCSRTYGVTTSAKILLDFAKSQGFDDRDDLETIMAYFVANMMHLANEEEVDFTKVLRSATEYCEIDMRYNR